MMKLRLRGLVFLIGTLFCNYTFALSEKRPVVIVISVDGLGAQLLSSVPPNEIPNLMKMARDGDQAIRAETIQKAQTVPGHASMLSGVDTPKHKSAENEMSPNLKKLEVQTIFDLVKSAGLKSAAYFGKEKLGFLFDTGAIDWLVTPRLWPIGDYWGRRPSVVTRNVEDVFAKHKPDFFFIHHAAVDSMGHTFQWESSIQRSAIRWVDESIGKTLDYLDASKESIEDYVVIVTADHGGHGGSHGQTNANGELENIESDLVIPWIIYRSPHAVKRDGKHVRLVNSKDVVKIYDTAATAASLIGIAIPKDWDGVNRVKFENEKN